jgi:hypothetical protein
LLAFALVANFAAITSGLIGDNRYLADLDVLARDPEHINAWHDYLNQRKSDVTGVLLVGDAQPFDLEVPAAYNTVFDDSVFEQLARGRTPAEVHRALAERRLSHILVDWAEVARYRSPGNYGFTRFVEPGIFQRLVTAGVLAEVPRMKDNPSQLYRVTPLR